MSRINSFIRRYKVARKNQLAQGDEKTEWARLWAHHYHGVVIIPPLLSLAALIAMVAYQSLEMFGMFLLSLAFNGVVFVPYLRWYLNYYGEDE